MASAGLPRPLSENAKPTNRAHVPTVLRITTRLPDDERLVRGYTYSILPNGRMVINQVNGNVIPISVELTELLGFLGASIHLRIPAGAVKLQYLGVPLKW